MAPRVDCTVITTIRVKVTPAVASALGAESCFAPATVDGRTGLQWRKAIVERALANGGTSWRKRYDPIRKHYEGVAFVVGSLAYFDEDRGRVHAAPPLLEPIRHDLPGEARYRTWHRVTLASALVHEHPVLSDAKLLSHLPRPKLARMLAETRRDAAQSARARV